VIVVNDSSARKLRHDDLADRDPTLQTEVAAVYMPVSKRAPLAICRRVEGQNSFSSALLSP
jgi:hypothetical protein